MTNTTSRKQQPELRLNAELLDTGWVGRYEATDEEGRVVQSGSTGNKSYRSADEAKTEALWDWRKANGIQVFKAPADLEPGDRIDASTNRRRAEVTGVRLCANGRYEVGVLSGGKFSSVYYSANTFVEVVR